MIAVSGWLIDDEDYKRMYGIVPDDLTLEERLERFYEIYCPERFLPFPCRAISFTGRLPKIEQEAFDWRGDPHHLMEQVLLLSSPLPLISS
jgi:hypothetical protein